MSAALGQSDVWMPTVSDAGVEASASGGSAGVPMSTGQPNPECARSQVSASHERKAGAASPATAPAMSAMLE